MGGSLFAPEDFTPVCTTELGYMQAAAEFAKGNVKILGWRRPVSSHQSGKRHRETQGAKSELPDDGDPQLKVAKLYGMLPGDAGESCEGVLRRQCHGAYRVRDWAPTKRSSCRSVSDDHGAEFDEILAWIDSSNSRPATKGDAGELDPAMT